MSEKEYIARSEMLSELRSGFFPQDVVYTEAVSIAEQIIRAAPAADVVPRSEVERLEREKEEMLVSATTDIPIRMETLFKVRTEHPIVKAIKDKVAREIFEDLQGLLIMRVGVNQAIAELKKKYTGEQNDG